VYARMRAMGCTHHKGAGERPFSKGSAHKGACIKGGPIEGGAHREGPCIKAIQ
jgi:hypothetical protein